MAWLVYSLQIFPEFLIGLLVVTLVTLLFAGLSFWTFKSKIGWFELSLGVYAGLSAFILVSYGLWFILEWESSLLLTGLIFSLGSLYGWWQARLRLDLKPTRLVIGSLLLAVGLSFFLFKMTYENGLHDEYFHYAALLLFETTQQYPFLSPYDFKQTLNETYHVGSYFVVMGLKFLLQTNLEKALDLAKLLFFFPLPLFLSMSLKKLWPKTGDGWVLFTVMAALMTGPSWWLRDSFSLWLTRGVELPQIYLPLLYDLAGVTWSGVVFWIVLTMGLAVLASYSKYRTWPYMLALGMVFLATILVNKAYMLTSVMSGLTVLGATVVFKLHLYKKYQRFLIPMAVILSAVGLLFAARSWLPAPLSTLLRTSENWGYPYATLLLEDGIQVYHSFIAWKDPRFLVSFGLAPLIIFGMVAMLIWRFHRQDLSTRIVASLFLVFAFLLPLGVYVASDSGLGLALNKLLRPAVFFVALVPLLLMQLKQKHLAWLVAGFLVLGMISPLRYYTVNVGSGLQQFWMTENQDLLGLVKVIQERKYSYILVANWGLAYQLSNLTAVQTMACAVCAPELALPHQSPVLILKQDPNELRLYSDLETVFENPSYVIKEL